MILRTQLSPVDSPHPFCLTIGNFDGVHLGHLSLLDRLESVAKERGARTAAITFSNHPSKVLRPDQTTPLLCTVGHKAKLLEKQGLDLAFLIEFTKEFSQQDPLEFLRSIKENLNVIHLVLGYDAVIGHHRQGSKERLPEIAKPLGITIEYVSPFQVESTTISSSLIRQRVAQGKLEATRELLGRPYSILGKVDTGAGIGKGLGFPTINLNTADLCLPPLGVYATLVHVQSKTWPAVANLGLAPSLQKRESPLLEVHLIDFEGSLYDSEVEVEFVQFLRGERCFPSSDELRAQIQRDRLDAIEVLGDSKTKQKTGT